MKFWRASLAFTALLVMYFCSLAASASWEQRVEELRVLNQLNKQEITKLQHTVDQLDKKLKVTDKRIVDLEAQPK